MLSVYQSDFVARSLVKCLAVITLVYFNMRQARFDLLCFSPYSSLLTCVTENSHHALSVSFCAQFCLLFIQTLNL